MGLLVGLSLVLVMAPPSTAHAGTLLCRLFGINCPPPPPPPPAAPYVTSLTVTPDHFDGYALYDIQYFTVTANWSDGHADPDLTRAGAPPQWAASYGFFELPYDGGRDRTEPLFGTMTGKERGQWADVAYPDERALTTTGKKVLWSSSFDQDAQGTVTVTYGGASAQVPVVVKNYATANGALLAWLDDYANIPLGISSRYPSSWFTMEYENCKPDEIYLAAWALRGPIRRAIEKARAEAEADRINRDLTDFIRTWAKGNQDPTPVPNGLLPFSLQNTRTRWVLMRPEDVKAEDQSVIRPRFLSAPQDMSRVYNLAGDWKASYVIMPYLGVFGATLTLEGEYPHARFMDLQISPPWDNEFPYGFGVTAPEVPIVDADIEPDPGNVNPYRVGADRNAPNRKYTMHFKLEKGNSVELNEAINPGSMSETPIKFRSLGSTNNTRVGGPFWYSGPAGCGQQSAGMLWQRIYALDHGTDMLGNAGYPKGSMQLSTGERFWLKAEEDALMTVRRRVNVPFDEGRDRAFGATRPNRPFTGYDSSFGWAKLTGILQAVIYNFWLDRFKWNAPGHEIFNEVVRVFEKRMVGRGEDAKPPGNLESGAGENEYTNYLVRSIWAQPGEVVAFTGKLPTFPHTRNGEPIMEAAQLRYWSISNIVPPQLRGYYFLPNLDSLSDDEITTDADGWYTIVFSRPEDRPANASAANGVTWGHHGFNALTHYIIRWTSVQPEWNFPAHVPDANNMPWKKAGYLAKNFDINKSAQRNDHYGPMGEYQPKIHLMSKEEFESLGPNPDPRTLPHSDDWY